MTFDLSQKNRAKRAKELLLTEKSARLATLSRKSSESMHSSVSLGGQIFVMVNNFN